MAFNATKWFFLSDPTRLGEVDALMAAELETIKAGTAYLYETFCEKTFCRFRCQSLHFYNF